MPINVASLVFGSTNSSRSVKDQLHCLPSNGLGTHITHHAFVAWFGFYARAPELVGMNCTRRQVRATLDPLGDHLLSCGSGAPHSILPHIRRHDQIVRFLVSEQSRAHRNPIVEPRYCNTDSTHANPYTCEPQPQPSSPSASWTDISALGVSGG